MIRSLLNRTTLDREEIVREDPHLRYESLLQRLGLPGSSPAALGITSCTSGEGVSTVAASLAATAASCTPRPVLLVDANLGRPAVHRLLGVKAQPGLAEMLVDGISAAIIQPSRVANLSVLPAGDTGRPILPSGDITSVGGVLERLKKEFSLIVIDLPPITGAGYVVPLAAVLEGILLVVEAEKLRRDAVQRQKELLGAANARLLGVIVNKQRRHVPAFLDRFL